MLTGTRKFLFLLCTAVMLISSVSPVVMGPGIQHQQGTSAIKEKGHSSGSGMESSHYTPIMGNPGSIKASLFVLNNTLLPGSKSMPYGYGTTAPVASVYDPTNGNLYILNYQSNNISILDTSTEAITGSIANVTNPVTALFDPVNGYIYIAGSGGVYVIDPLTSSVARFIACGNINTYVSGGNVISAISYDSQNNTVFVANMYSDNISVISAGSNTVVNTFNFSSHSAEPNGLAYDPANNMIYITDYNLHLVYIYNSSSYKRVTNLSLPSSTDGGSIYYDPASNSILIGSQSYIRLYVLNTANDSFLPIVPAGTPYAMQYDPVNNTMLVALYSGNVIEVLNSRNAIIGNITTFLTGESFTFVDTPSTYLYLDENTYNAVSIFNASTASFIAEKLFNAQPSGEAYDPVNGNLYVTDYSSNAVYVINASTNRTVDTVFLPEHPGAIIYDPGNGMIYAGGNYMSTIDPSTDKVISSVYFFRLPYIAAMTYDPSTGYIYTANHGNFSISAFDTVTGTIPYTYRMSYNSYPSGIVYNPSDGYIYTDGFLDDTIYILNATNLELVRTITLANGFYPAQAAYDPLSGDVYVCSETSGDLSVIGSGGLVATIPTSTGTLLAAFNPSNNMMYVSGNTLLNGNASLYVINAYTNSIKTVLDTGNFLGAMVYVHASRTLYASSNAGEDIYLMGGFAPTNYTVNFSETGLPAGTQWGVNLSTLTSLTGTGNILSTSLPNGTYYFTVRSQNSSYGAAGGNFTVSGSNMTVAVAFSSAKYTVNFNAIGLPAGTTWWANVTGHSGASSTTGTVSVSLVDGTYTYRISSENKTMKPAPGTGTFTVDGSGISLNVSFGEVRYSVTFTMLGLPYGYLAFVNLSNGMSANTTTLSVAFYLPNGTYGYKLSTPNGTYDSTPGQFTVSGSSRDLPVFFNAVLFEVNFTESGLSPGAVWFLNITGQPGSGPLYGNVYSVNLTNGTYSYSAVSTNNSLGNTFSSFTVNGTSMNIPITFSLALYTITFSESSLPSGTEWFVNISGGYQIQAATGQMAVNLSDGTYTYTAQSADKSYRTGGGTFSVSGFAETLHVTFSPVTFNVTINESGLPPGTAWYVNYTGHASGQITSSVFYLNLINGSYSLQISSANPAYSAVNPVLTLIMNGAPVTENVSFTTAESNVTFSESGLPGGYVWYINLSNGQNYNTSSASATVILADGSYSYSIHSQNRMWTASPHNGSFTASGSSITVTVLFVPVQYRVNFTEKNPSFHSAWYLNITGQKPLSGTGQTTLTIDLGNGTYQFIAHSLNSTYQSYRGTFTINGRNIQVNVTFTKVVYTLSFKETGLSAGTTWSVTLNGLLKSSASSTISFAVTNGTYRYSMTSLDAYYITSGENGSDTVAGQPGQISVTFKAYAHISGTILPANATLTVNGVIQPLTSGNFNVTVEGGSIHIVVTGKGYKTYYQNFTILSGQYKSFSIVLSGNSSAITPSGSSPPFPLVFVIVPVIAVIAVAGAVIALRRRKT